MHEKQFVALLKIIHADFIIGLRVIHNARFKEGVADDPIEERLHIHQLLCCGRAHSRGLAPADHRIDQRREAVGYETQLHQRANADRANSRNLA